MADESSFSPGDVVRLKSGGPALTVMWVNADGHYGCKWWNHAASKYEVEKFLPTSLFLSSSDQF